MWGNSGVQLSGQKVEEEKSQETRRLRIEEIDTSTIV